MNYPSEEVHRDCSKLVAPEPLDNTPIVHINYNDSSMNSALPPAGSNPDEGYLSNVSSASVAPEEALDNNEINTPASPDGATHETSRRTRRTSRPTVAILGNTIQSPNYILHVVKDCLLLMILPAVVWGATVSSIPMYPETKGFSWQTFISSSSFWQSATYCGSFSILSTIRLFYPVTLRMWFFSASSTLVWLLLVGFVAMTLNMYPLPFHAVWCSLGWLPCNSVGMYIQLVKNGSLDKTKEQMITFFKYVAMFFSFVVYFVVCSAYLIGMLSFSDKPMWQMVVSAVFNVSSHQIRKGMMAVTPLLIPPHAHSTDSEDPRDSSIRLGLYFAHGMSKQLFVTFSFSGVNDYTSAAFVIAMEILPETFFWVTLTGWYYELKNKRSDNSLSVFGVENYRLMLVELYTLHSYSEICSCAGFLIMAPIWRFGWNRDFFPLRHACDSEFNISIIFVVVQAVLLLALVAVNGVWVKKRYNISFARVMAGHLLLNKWHMLAMMLCVYFFPTALLWRQSNILPILSSDTAYQPNLGC